VNGPNGGLIKSDAGASTFRRASSCCKMLQPSGGDAVTARLSHEMTHGRRAFELVVHPTDPDES
jgi:hypothetical protein